MPSSPQTPKTHSRHPSNIDLSSSTPLSYNQSSPRADSLRLQSPTTPKYQHAHSLSRTDSIGMDGTAAVVSNGLGNLADELADMEYDDEEDEYDEEPDMNFQEVRDEVEPQRDSGIDVASSPVQSPQRKRSTLTLPNLMQLRGHRRTPSEYDGSDYGGDSDLDSPGVPPGLQARMDMIEGLARRGTENNGTAGDGVVNRVVEGLKDLGGQSGVEGGATRLITAHAALSTHLLHQTRLLQSLAYPLFSPLVLPPSEEEIDELLPLLVTISESIPRPTTIGLTSLTQLHTMTGDLVQTLNSLSDTLHMSRQTTASATRSLKTARELVAGMRKDEEEREEGERWLTKNNWSERLGRRECASVCGDVVGGFEDVCNDWRARLLAQAEAVPA